MNNQEIHAECQKRIPFYQELEETSRAKQTWVATNIPRAYLDLVRNTLGAPQNFIELQRMKKNSNYQFEIDSYSTLVFEEDPIARKLLGPCEEGEIPKKVEEITE